MVVKGLVVLGTSGDLQKGCCRLVRYRPGGGHSSGRPGVMVCQAQCELGQHRLLSEMGTVGRPGEV